MTDRSPSSPSRRRARPSWDGTSFAGVGRAAGEKFLQPIEVLTTTFWDAYLKGDAAAKASLTSGKAWSGPGVALTAK
jgi:hypothetical protein